jgi:hypothetical protein
VSKPANRLLKRWGLRGADFESDSGPSSLFPGYASWVTSGGEEAVTGEEGISIDGALLSSLRGFRGGGTAPRVPFRSLSSPAAKGGLGVPGREVIVDGCRWGGRSASRLSV